MWFLLENNNPLLLKHSAEISQQKLNNKACPKTVYVIKDHTQELYETSQRNTDTDIAGMNISIGKFKFKTILGDIECKKSIHEGTLNKSGKNSALQKYNERENINANRGVHKNKGKVKIKIKKQLTQIKIKQMNYLGKTRNLNLREKSLFKVEHPAK